MPKKVKKVVVKPVEPEEPIEPVVEEKPAPDEEEVAKEEKPETEIPAPPTTEEVIDLKPKKVKVKVLVGTLSWEDGKFEKGETFETTRERAKLFDQKDIKIVK